MTRRPRAWALLAVAAGLTLTACSTSTDGTQVASLKDAGGSTAGSAGTAASASAGTEAELLAYVQCLRDQGVDIADPTVDADGNLTLGGGGPGSGSGTGTPTIDHDALLAAQDVCGAVPAGAFGSAVRDTTEFQDAALAFVQCMRDEGIEVADPDFSTTSGPGGGGMLGDVDRTDPAVIAALETCQGDFAAARDAIAAAGTGA
ncbi:MAG TPA: hypothetical protein VMV41_13980 [Cellulomonadaceae bacterium]|nr:hypothetical protein [Cellulomonadaceae bacterium]